MNVNDTLNIQERRSEGENEQEHPLQQQKQQLVHVQLPLMKLKLPGLVVIIKI